MAALQTVTFVGLTLMASVPLTMESLLKDGMFLRSPWILNSLFDNLQLLAQMKVLFFWTFRYHIPRSYLNYGEENTLILFEEFGGSPLDIDIQTTRVKKVCAMPYAGSTLELSCHDRTIYDINFVSFGNPDGTCDNFQKGSCESSTALSVIEKV